MKKKTIITFLITVIILLIILMPKTVHAAEEDLLFSDDITWEWEYFSEEETDTMAYGIMIPSNADKFEEIPMIVTLHGWGGYAPSEEDIRTSGLPRLFTEWELENFSAYILCPRNPRRDCKFNVTEIINKVQDLIDYVIEEYNVDADNIIIHGESRGGTGALALASALPDYFSKCVAASAYNPCMALNTSMDTLCFYSWYADSASKFGKTLEDVFGKERVFANNAGHGSVGWCYFQLDGGELADARNRRRTAMVDLTSLSGCSKIVR